MNLELIKKFLGEVNSSNSSLYKKEILSKSWNNDLKSLFCYLYDYDKQYYVTSKNILKYYGIFKDHKKEYNDIIDLLNDLNNRIYTGHDAIKNIIYFIKQNENYKDIILKIIDKDLEIGVSETTINKLFPKTVKTFNVALACKLDDKITLDDSWYISRKLDGCRCICFYNNKNDIKFFSRQGKEFTTLDILKQELSKFDLPENTVFDGEICITDENGSEDFQSIIKEIKRKDHTIQNPCYMIFDILTRDEFDMTIESRKFSVRYWNLLNIFNTQLFSSKNFKLVEQLQYNKDNIQYMQNKVNRYNWEGLMLRKDVTYKGERSRDLLKMKSFCDSEYIVEAIEEGESQEVINGIVTKIKCVGSLIIKHKGNRVNVGSGLSLEQRKRWFEHPEEIIGKTICVKYFSEVQNQNGLYSLRFPVLKGVYNGRRNV